MKTQQIVENANNDISRKYSTKNCFWLFNSTMKISTREHKVFSHVELPNRFWPQPMKQDKYPPNSTWSIKCMKVTHKSIYFFALFILVITLLLQIYRCYDQRARGHTYVETKIVPQRDALFPAMTICPGISGYKRDKLQVRVNNISRISMSV